MTNNPEIQFYIHDVFINAFSFPTADKDKELFREKVNQSREYLADKCSKYLDRIGKLSGYGWEVDTIPVYLVPSSARFKSFAKVNLENELPGIVLRTYKTFEILEFVFIHELCHVNQMQSDFWRDDNPWCMKDGIKNTEGIELCADIVTLYVIRDMYGENSDQEKEFWDFLTVSPVNVAKGEAVRQKIEVWDLKKAPLRFQILNLLSI